MDMGMDLDRTLIDFDIGVLGSLWLGHSPSNSRTERQRDVSFVAKEDPEARYLTYSEAIVIVSHYCRAGGRHPRAAGGPGAPDEPQRAAVGDQQVRLQRRLRRPRLPGG